MYLTPQQEEQLIDHYTPFVHSVVYHFKARTMWKLDNYEDLFQECMIVLSESIRMAPSMTGYRPPVRDMINAMCRYTLIEQTLSYPKGTSRYGKFVKTGAHKTTLKSVENAVFNEQSIQNGEDRIFYQDFLNTLTPEERMLVHLKLHGGTNRYAAQVSGLPEMTVSRRIKRVYEKYKKFIAA